VVGGGGTAGPLPLLGGAGLLLAGGHAEVGDAPDAGHSTRISPGPAILLFRSCGETGRGADTPRPAAVLLLPLLLRYRGVSGALDAVQELAHADLERRGQFEQGGRARVAAGAFHLDNALGR